MSSLSKQYSSKKNTSEPTKDPVGGGCSGGGRTVIQQKLRELHKAVCERFLFNEVTIFWEQQRHNCNVVIESEKVVDRKTTRIISNKRKESMSEGGGDAVVVSVVSSSKQMKLTNNEQTMTTQVTTPINRKRASSVSNSSSNILDSCCNKTWTEMVRDLSSIVSFMTENEHQFACKLITLCLLSYCAPHSTNSFTKINTTTSKDNTKNEESSFLNQLEESLPSLEEIMGNMNQQHHYGLSSSLAQTQYTPIVLQNECLSLSFWDFLYNGLRPFLASRSLNPQGGGFSTDYDNNHEKINNIHCGANDLLHTLAMIISPEIHPTKLIMFSKRAQYFISLRQPLYFELSYIQRSDIVNVLSQSLVLTQIIETSSIEYNARLTGGIDHLRASLKRFRISALSNHHIIDAQRTMSNIAIDTGINVIGEVKSLIQYVSNRGCDISSEKGTNNNCRRNQSYPTTTIKPPDKRIQQRFILAFPTMSKSKLISQQQCGRFERDRQTLCIHCSIGSILRDLILRFNGARHYADEEFTRQSLAELTGAIATALGSMEQQGDDVSTSTPNNNNNNNSLPTSCTVSSLLDAATILFYFLHHHHSTVMDTSETDQNGENDNLDDDHMLEIGMKEALFECTIQLLRSPNECVVTSASSLLALGFSYCDINEIQKFIPSVYKAIQSQFQFGRERWKYQSFLYVVKMISRISLTFAKSLSSSLIDSINSKEIVNVKSREHILALISAIAQMQPKAMLGNLSSLVKACDNVDSLSTNCKREVISIIFMCRQSFILPADNWSIHEQSATRLLESLLDGWSIYLLTRVAFCTGNFGIAAEIMIQKKLLNELSSSTKSHVWFTSLLTIAQAESVLAKEGSTAIPSALMLIDSAINKLSIISNITSCSTSFQEQYLCRRKDFFQLCLSLRGICAEMRLINSEGSLHSRTRIHQKNMSKCFYMLASQYSTMYKTYGAIYCNQSRSSIRSTFALCCFLGDLSSKIFYQSSQHSAHELHSERSINWPKGDINNVQCNFLAKLRLELVESLDESVQPHIRAESMIEILDVICKSPFSYPRDFFSFKKISPIEISISAIHMESIGKHYDTTESDTVEVKIGSPFVLSITGILPQAYFSKGSLSFSQIVAYISIIYHTNLDIHNEYEDVDENNNMKHDVDSSHDDIKESIECAFDLLPLCEHINSDGRVLIGCKFSIPVSCEPLYKEGFYSPEVDLCLRGVRGEEFCIPISEDSQGIIISCLS